MLNIRRVFWFEFLNVIKRRSFIVSMILVPLIPILLLGGLRLLNRDSSQTIQEIFIKEAASPLPIGVVDNSNLIKEYPNWATGGQLIAQESEEVARERTAAGQLQGFYLIEEDYLQSGKLRFIKPEVNMITELVQQDQLKSLIEYNLLGADEEVYLRYTNPATFNYEYLNPETADTRDQSEASTYWLPYVVTMFFYMVVLISSSTMLGAISKDKENKVIEMLLSSVSPLDLFLGKILALGLVSLVQMLVWFGTIVLLPKIGGVALPFLADFDVSASLVLSAIPFFIGGFLLYGSLMAGLGALAPNLREANQSNFVLMLPLIFTVMAIAQLIENPNSAFTTFMTLFPFTSPVVMMTRISIGQVPAWQIIACLILLFGTVVVVMRGVANLISSQALLSGQKVKIGQFLKTVFVGHPRK